jgi:hypothetical protein
MVTQHPLTELVLFDHPCHAVRHPGLAQGLCQPQIQTGDPGEERADGDHSSHAAARYSWAFLSVRIASVSWG